VCVCVRVCVSLFIRLLSGVGSQAIIL
jgi:hypothetical protein